LTVTEPVEDAKVELPEYVASITCDPDTVDEKVYVAEPFERARDEVSVVPSTTMVRVPVGVEVMDFDSGDTVMVMVSVAPEAGVLVAAVRELVVGSSDEEGPGVHAVSRLYRSTEPRPVASSYPVMAGYSDSPDDEQYCAPAVHWFPPLVTSWKAEAYVLEFAARV
jgi:hypothetical protein